MKTILIIGSEGMLGQELVKTFKKDKDYSVIAWDKKEIDITDPKQVNKKIGELKPSIILNAAAYNAVDKCEDPKEFKLAKKLNGNAPQYLAKVAKKLKATLVHYSTDYVFDGQPEVDLEPAGCSHSCGSCQLHESFVPEIGFKEDAKPKPISNYGKSKLLGEKAVQKEKGKYYIIRLSKLFGEAGKSECSKKSFFDVMLEAGRLVRSGKNKEVKVIDEETSCFTYAPDLAKKTKEILEAQKPFGIYHVTNGDPCTWHEAVVELYKQAKLKTKVIPVSADEFLRPAKRPFISTLLNTKLNPMRSYKEALRDYLKK
jgi:dTDP-4-dehydrorhamnose reductase